MADQQELIAALSSGGAAWVSLDADGNAVGIRTPVHSRLSTEQLIAMSKLKTLIEVQIDADDEALQYVAALPSLKRLDVAITGFGSAVTDEGLKHLKNLTNLEYLGLRAVRVTDAGMVHLKGLRRLKGLDVSLSQVTLAGLQKLKSLKELTYLHAPDSLSLEYVRMFPNLQTILDIGTTDDELMSLAGLSKLSELGIESSGVTDAGMVHLAPLRSLKKLYLVDTAVSNNAVQSLRAALPTCEIVY